MLVVEEDALDRDEGGDDSKDNEEPENPLGASLGDSEQLRGEPTVGEQDGMEEALIGSSTCVDGQTRDAADEAKTTAGRQRHYQRAAQGVKRNMRPQARRMSSRQTSLKMAQWKRLLVDSRTCFA